MASSTTADYVKLLEEEGDFQSSGRFSLEAKKALQKMQAFRLSNPSEFVLQLVSCAVMRGASQIQIDVGGRDVRVGFDGEPFSDDELELVFECALQQSHQPVTAASAHLAIALQAMRTFSPDVLIVESGQGKQRNVLQLYEEEVWVEVLAGLPQRKVVTYVGLENSLNFVNLCFPSLVRRLRPEAKILQEWAHAAPIPVYVNGRCLDLPWAQQEVLLGGPGCPPRWAEGRKNARHRPELPFWGLVQLRRHEPRKLSFVQAGVIFEEPRLPKDFPADVSLYLVGDHLKRDLSQRNLVNDDAKAELQEQGMQALTQLRMDK